MIKDRWNELRIKASQFSSDRTSIAVDDLHDFDKVYPTSQSTFFNKVHEIRKILAGLAADIAEVKIRLHSLPAQTIFDGREKEKLDECLRAIKYRSNLLRGHLLAMQRNEKEVEKEQQTDSDITARIRKCHIEAMNKTLSVLIEKLNSAQLDYRIQVLKKIKRQLVIAGEHMTDDEINAIVDSESPEIFNRQFRSSQLKSALASVTVRHAGFVNLEKSMKELHHLYNDFAFLVHSQGEMIDRTDQNISAASDHVKAGNEQTRTAVKYGKSKMRRDYYYLSIASVLLLIVFIFFTLIVYFSTRRIRNFP